MAEDFLNLPNKKGQDTTNVALQQIADKLGVTTDALASAVNLANKAGNDANAKIADVESRFQTLTTAQQQASEVVDARRGKASLRAKIDVMDAQSNDIAKQFNAQLAQTKDEVLELIGNIANGTPLFADSVPNMTDTTRIYLNTTDGYLYANDGASFKSTGVVYLSNSIEEYMTEENKVWEVI